MRHSNDNVRDLAASILEKTEVLTPAMKEKLYYVMKDDSNRFARFRAACAIAAHDSKYHAAEVKAVLVDIAKKDKEVSDIAGGYLKKYPN